MFQFHQNNSQLLFHVIVSPWWAGTFSRGFTKILARQCRARILVSKIEKLKASLFPGPGGAGDANDWCIICYIHGNICEFVWSAGILVIYPRRVSMINANINLNHTAKALRKAVLALNPRFKRSRLFSCSEPDSRARDWSVLSRDLSSNPILPKMLVWIFGNNQPNLNAYCIRFVPGLYLKVSVGSYPTTELMMLSGLSSLSVRWMAMMKWTWKFYMLSQIQKKKDKD